MLLTTHTPCHLRLYHLESATSKTALSQARVMNPFYVVGDGHAVLADEVPEQPPHVPHFSEPGQLPHQLGRFAHPCFAHVQPLHGTGAGDQLVNDPGIGW